MIMIKTKRLILDEVIIDDALTFWELSNNYEIMSFFGLKKVNKNNSKEALIEFINGYKNGHLWALRLNNDMIGILAYLDNQIGYAVLPKYQNKGYATEALNAILNDYDTLYAITSIDNFKSQRVLEKTGFKKMEITSLGYLYKKQK